MSRGGALTAVAFVVHMIYSWLICDDGCSVRSGKFASLTPMLSCLSKTGTVWFSEFWYCIGVCHSWSPVRNVFSRIIVLVYTGQLFRYLGITLRFWIFPDEGDSGPVLSILRSWTKFISFLMEEITCFSFPWLEHFSAVRPLKPHILPLHFLINRGALELKLTWQDYIRLNLYEPTAGS